MMSHPTTRFPQRRRGLAKPAPRKASPRSATRFPQASLRTGEASSAQASPPRYALLRALAALARASPRTGEASPATSLGHVSSMRQAIDSWHCSSPFSCASTAGDARPRCSCAPSVPRRWCRRPRIQARCPPARRQRVTFSPRSDGPAQEVGGGLALGGEVGGQDDFLHHAVVARRMTRSKPARAGRCPPAARPGPSARSTGHGSRGWTRSCSGPLASRRCTAARIALGIGAGGADLVFGEAVAARAVAQVLHRAGQRPAQHVRPLQIMLHQVVGHAPGRTHAHAGQAPPRSARPVVRVQAVGDP